MFPLASPPDDIARTGDAADTIEAVARHITAEERIALDVATTRVRLTPTGRLDVAGDTYALEESGLRALLQHYTAAFPRLTPAALLMRPGTLAAVLHAGLADHAGSLPLEVRLRLRRGALYAATPTSAPAYDVDAVLRDLAAVLPSDAGPTTAAYAAGESAAVALVSLPSVAPGAWFQVEVSDGYPCRVSVSCGVGDRSCGDPDPARERRRRSVGGMAGEGVYRETFAAKLEAVACWLRAKGAV